MSCQCIQPAKEGYKRGIPVNGNLVGSIRLVIVNVRLIGGVMQTCLILLTGIRSTDKHAGERRLDTVGY